MNHIMFLTYVFTKSNFMQLADTFIQIDLHCIRGAHQLLLSLAIECMTSALLSAYSTV